MTTTAPTVKPTAPKRVPMTSLRKTSLDAGVLYLVTFVSIPTLFLYNPVQDHPDFIIGAGNETQRPPWLPARNLIKAAACIGTAVALFPVVKRQNKGVALGFVTSRIMEASIIFIGVVSLLSIVTLRQDSGTPGADPACTRHHRPVSRRDPSIGPSCSGPHLLPASTPCCWAP